MTWTCGVDESKAPPSRWIMNTTDIVFDASNLEGVTEWILDTHFDFIDKRSVHVA
jgi:hypothetical protein